MNDKPIEKEGLKAKNRHTIRVVLFTAGQSVFSGFLVITELGYQGIVKYLLPSLSIPLEILNLIVQVYTLVRKQKPLKLIITMILLSLLALTILSITDAVRWGGWTTGFLASVAAAGPAVFTGILGTISVLNVLGLIQAARQLYQKPIYRTPLKKFNVVNKSLKTLGFSLLASFMLPMSLAVASNPVGATIIISFVGATLVMLVAMKIIKTVYENRTWKKTIHELNTAEIDVAHDPYELLGIDKELLAEKVNAEVEKTFFEKLWTIFLHSGQSIFGTPEQKEKIKAAEKNTSSAYVEQCFESKVKQNPASLCMLQKSYDLLRKSRGRLMYEQAMQKKEKAILPSTVTADEEGNRLLEAGLEEPQYIRIYEGEKGYHHKEISPAIGKKHIEIESPRIIHQDP